MKKLICSILCICLLIAGCGSQGGSTWAPERASNDISPYAKRAIDAITGYLEGTVSSDEASSILDDLNAIMKDRGVTDFDNDTTYGDADRQIAHAIGMISIGEIDYWSERECMMYRDILRFQIGEETSGNTYATDPIDPYDDPLVEALVPSSTPATYAFGYMDDENRLSLNFDYINGVSSSDLNTYIQDIVRAAERKNITIDRMSIYYACYGQVVFYIVLKVADGNVSGGLYVVSTSPAGELGEHNAFSVINSLDDLPKALQTAQAYFGRN